VPAPDRKEALRQELLAQLSAALDAARRAYASAVEGATHTEARAENDKDTRGLEQSYLARGQAQRVEELTTAVAAVEVMALRRFGADEAIGLGALATVEEDGARHVYFIAGYGGGMVLGGGEVQVVTPRSPLGRALVGKCPGDDGEVHTPGKVRALEIVAIE